MLIFLFILTATQFNLAEIAALGLNVPFADRLATTAQDLVGGLPLIATVLGFGFLIAMPVINGRHQQEWSINFTAISHMGWAAMLAWGLPCSR